MDLTAARVILARGRGLWSLAGSRCGDGEGVERGKNVKEGLAEEEEAIIIGSVEILRFFFFLIFFFSFSFSYFDLLVRFLVKGIVLVCVATIAHGIKINFGEGICHSSYAVLNGMWIRRYL